MKLLVNINTQHGGPFVKRNNEICGCSLYFSLIQCHDPINLEDFFTRVQVDFNSLLNR